MNHPIPLIPLFFLLITASYAFPRFVSQFPNGDAGSREGSGITCDHLGHQNCVEGAPRNPFGQDWDDNGQKWDKALCEKDSDGDGITNGAELGDPCCLWTLQNPTPLRQNMLSHPGEKSEDGAKEAPGCPPSPTPTSSKVPADPTPSVTPSKAGAPTPATASTTPTATPSKAGAPTPATASATPSRSPTDAGDTSPTATPPTATPTATPTSTPDDDAVCFPAHARVQLENGLTKRMDQLEIGDRVHTGGGQYSDVFLFTHKVPGVSHEFVTIRAGTEDKLEASVTLTKGHFIYANGKAVTADQVKIGDMLELHDGRKSSVIEVECATFKGLYNPATTHGDMIVDEVKVSTYTTAVQSGIAHSLLAPLRAIYRWLGWSPLSLEKGAPRIAKFLS